jgi:hypothetical protein
LSRDLGIGHPVRQPQSGLGISLIPSASRFRYPRQVVDHHSLRKASTDECPTRKCRCARRPPDISAGPSIPRDSRVQSAAQRLSAHPGACAFRWPTGGDPALNCPDCEHGCRRIFCPVCRGQPEEVDGIRCIGCDGVGYVESDCPTCGGTGTVSNRLGRSAAD